MHSSSRFARSVAIGALAALCTTMLTPTTFAHERREVGKYSMSVGFNAEPPFLNEMNGAQFTITIPSEDGRGVEGLASSLKVSVAAGGGQAKEFPLRSVFGTPGRYVADFMPTRPGTYVFHLTGSIEGTTINERFESGPGRFNDVQDVEPLQFPEPMPAANEAARIARAASDQAVEAQSAAEGLRAAALGGLAAGVLGLVVGLGAIVTVMTRRSPAAVPDIR